MRIRAYQEPLSDGLKVLIEDGRFVVKPVEFELIEKPQDGLLIEPTFSLDGVAAQDLMNELWRAGFRPKDGRSSLAHVGAVEKHLEDMRTIAFHKLGIKP